MEEKIAPVLFRYFILLLVYAILFYNFIKKYQSIKFHLFILFFIVNFIAIVFLFRDMMTIRDLVASVLQAPLSDVNLQGMYINVFLIAIFLTLTIQFISIILILVVFDYAKKSKHNYTSYKMISTNERLLNKYTIISIITTAMLLSFAFVVIILCAGKNLKVKIMNIIGIIISGLILGLSTYGLVTSVKFFNIKKHKKALYE